MEEPRDGWTPADDDGLYSSRRPTMKDELRLPLWRRIRMAAAYVEMLASVAGNGGCSLRRVADELGEESEAFRRGHRLASKPVDDADADQDDEREDGGAEHSAGDADIGEVQPIGHRLSLRRPRGKRPSTARGRRGT
jgi:hypothetical protein